MGAKCDDEENGNGGKNHGHGNGDRAELLAKVFQQLTQKERLFPSRLGGCSGGWGRVEGGIRPGVRSSGGAVSLNHLHLFIHSFIYLFINCLLYMSNVPGVISHTGGQSCKYTVPGLREHPNSISPALTLAPWFVSLRRRPMCSVFSGCKDHQNEMHGGSTEVNRKGCLYSITPTTHPDTQRCPCPSRSHPKGLPGLWISLNVSLYSWEIEPREGVTPLKSHTASLN